MLRCSVEMRRRYSTTKNVIVYDYVNFACMPRGPPRSQQHTILSTQRPRQKGTTKSLHDMSSMIALAQTEGASSTWLQGQAIGPVVEHGPNLILKGTTHLHRHMVIASSD